MIVSDSGPIIAFSRVGRLDILKRLFGYVIIPDAVYEEFVVMGKGRPGEPEVRQSEWIQHRSVRNRERIDRFSQSLHEGERDAISLARELAKRRCSSTNGEAGAQRQTWELR